MKKESTKRERGSVGARIEFICPTCAKENLVEADLLEDTVRCSQCGSSTALVLSEGVRSGASVDQCCLCGGHRFYVQKDFNPRLGLAIFAVGVLFSYHTYGITLFVASAIDFVLYQVLPTVIVCYRCRTLYRGYRTTKKLKAYDPNVAIKYVKLKNREVESHEGAS